MSFDFCRLSLFHLVLNTSPLLPFLTLPCSLHLRRLQCLLRLHLLFIIHPRSSSIPTSILSILLPLLRQLLLSPRHIHSLLRRFPPDRGPPLWSSTAFRCGTAPLRRIFVVNGRRSLVSVSVTRQRSRFSSGRWRHARQNIVVILKTHAGVRLAVAGSR
jgi:hypothetical protein